MNRKYIGFVAVLLAALMSLSGCGKEETPQKPENSPEPPKPDYTMNYTDILDDYYTLIQNPNVEVDYDEGKLGVVETANYLGDDALDAIGYLFKDINGDAVPELLIGDVRAGEAGYTKNTLYAVFTMQNDNPIYVLEGRSRSSYSLMENNNFYYHGSNGAAYTIFGEYELTKNAELVCRDFNFSYPTDSDMLDVRFYHNTTGVYDKTAAEEMNITSEDFMEMEDALAARTVLLSFTPFSAFTPEEGGKGPTPTESPRPMVPPFCGEWTCTVRLEDGPYTLFLSLPTSRTAQYKCGPAESEYMVNFKGEWSWDAETITLKMKDSIEGGNFNGVYKWELKDNILTLTHQSGDAFIYSMSGSSFTFFRK